MLQDEVVRLSLHLSLESMAVTEVCLLMDREADMCLHMRAGVDERQPGHQRGHQDQRVRVQHAGAVVQRGHGGSKEQQHTARRAQRPSAAAHKREPEDLPGRPPGVEQSRVYCGKCMPPALPDVSPSNQTIGGSSESRPKLCIALLALQFVGDK